MAIATLSVLHGYRETGITWALHKQEVRLHYCCVRVHLTSKMLLVLLDAAWRGILHTLYFAAQINNTLQ